MSAVTAIRYFGRTASALLLAAAAWFGGGASAADPLGRFPVDSGQVSVSGISSGAFMANQLHVAHSAGIMGAGIIAGGLYGCAVNSLKDNGVDGRWSIATGACMTTPTFLQPVDSYSSVVTELADRGWIDPPSNLAGSHVYMFIGGADAVVNSATVELSEQLYQTLGVPTSQIVFHDKDYQAGHSWVTKNCCQDCAANKTPYIDNCNYDQAGDILRTIYGPLQPPAIPPTGRIVPFDQTEFVPGKAAKANGMSETGYMYIPKACEARAAQLCRLHVALHGCGQSAEVLQEPLFYTKVGLNEWADTNKIIVLYPQAHATTVSELPSQNALSTSNTNPAGCWNWWGYAFDTQFLTKQGVQISALWSMVQRVTDQSN
jgi:poly(3-hydroxybutyrate) depolymerase